MTEAADLLLVNAEVHSLVGADGNTDGDADETFEALAVRDGQIVRLGSTYDVEFLAGSETEVVDLDGRVVLPGFVDAHVHLSMTGRYLVHANLSGVSRAGEAVDRLRERADEVGSDEWVQGYGYDESTWDEPRYLTREDLDGVSETQPVVAFREDMHVASLNSVALERCRAGMPDDDVHTEGGEPTGVVVEEAVDPVFEAVEPDAGEMRELLAAAQRRANELGTTGVHDMVRHSRAPQVYREMDLAGDLSLRVRINYWADHLDALEEAGLRTNHGSEMVRTGAIKSYTDGSFGGRTAKLSEPYSDDADATGQWVVDPEELGDIVARADDAGFQMTAHAIGDEAIDAVLDAYSETGNPGEMRHRVEHVELASDEALERFGELGVVASVQPNFLKWADEGGLYASRLGDRRTQTNRYPALLDAGAPLAFGSDCMPLDPLLGVHWAVNAPAESQRLGVTEALRAYTLGAAYAGFDEERLGTVEVGKCADLTVLEESPWDHADEIRDLGVAMTVVDGDAVYDGR
ncbi:amidohydrolase [Haloprofundus marisrubri]|uniref:Amidohydrolase n=1 Tax=Haloprofundus marisrubri TaxID=1514971 RepID=A0A0W1R881_9EURY|nr:amidohydrolase [Haloprofundus marisrubri]KTG09188.1 amidohydrolase [Haloprofundus marisrubri]